MAVKTAAALSTTLKRSEIDNTAVVHSFSDLLGDVKVGAHVLIAPGTSIRADQGTSFAISEGTVIQEGVIIYGHQTGKVLGDDGQDYSVWIGKEVCLAHMALINGPVYIGDQCFVGFRSTLFNARVGQGSIIMMHALVQDVEIAPGKLVPSGSIVTSQEQADRLPDIRPKDRQLAGQIMELAKANQSSDNQKELSIDSQKLGKTSSQKQYKKLVDNMSLTAEIKEQIRSLLNQGYTIGVEHADKRRFKTSSWLSCGTITNRSLDQVIQQLEGYLAEYAGEYIRLIGVDSKLKKRVLETIIQRPDGAEISVAAKKSTGQTATKQSSSSSGAVDNNIASHVRSLLGQGCKISTEHANIRRFKTSSWQTGGVIESKNEGEILKTLNSIMAENQGEYVRLIGINPTAKRRVLELIIQRPGETSTTSSSKTTNTTHSSNNNPSTLSTEIVHQVRSLLQQGYKIGTEHADKRRFKTSSWSSCAPIESTREADVLQALATCLVEHQGEYVRLLGIDTKAKRRVLETVIQRPGETAQHISSHAQTATKVENQPVSYNGNGHGHSHLDGDTLAQVRSLLQQGYKIGTEHADKRRFKTSSWNSCSPIESNRENDIIAALTTCLQEHSGEYVRLIGIDTKAKRRVLETIIQRP